MYMQVNCDSISCFQSRLMANKETVTKRQSDKYLNVPYRSKQKTPENTIKNRSRDIFKKKL